MAELNKKQQEVLDLVSAMSVLELADLVKAMEEKFGVSAAAPAAAAAAPVAAAPVEEKTIFDVVLENAGSNKIGVIKVIKDLTGLGLTEAKDFVESAPKTVKEGVAKAEADEIVAKLKEAGATVTVK
jgi:large subunit ribosomal protein L7/L12